MSLIRRGGALVALLLGALLASMAPAQAAGPAVELSLPDTSYLPKRGVSPTGGIRLWLNPQPGAGRPAQSDVTMTVDASDLEGTVQLRTRRECGDHAFGDTFTVTCKLGTLTRGKFNAPDAVYIEAVHGVPRGSHGTLRVTFSAPGAEDVTYESDVWVEGPDLRPRVEKIRRGDTAGKSFGFKPQVRNAGKFPAEGFAVKFDSAHLNFPAKYSNCEYALARWATCWFDQTLEPGQAYEFADPIDVGVPTSMVNGSFTYSPYLPGLTGDAEDETGETADEDGMTRGTGPELRVRPVEGEAKDFMQKYRAGEVELRTSQTSDLQATAGVIRGRTGETVDVTVGVQNAGPGRISKTSLEITPPEGTTIVEPTPPDDPDNESEWEWECAGTKGKPYTCNPDRALEPDDIWSTTLQFRIDKRVRGAKGLLEIREAPERPARDPHRADNAVPIEIDATGGPLVDPSRPNPVPAAAAAEEKPTSKGGTIAVVAILGLTFASGVYVRRRRAKSRAKELAASEEAATSKTEPSGD
ncbi:hypothetical protein [Streptomyces sp. NBC_01304]|uniref:hypothetical protein n=1 Tax=Streptomyces sp. NBC_01304 TaxID=2903818 RepID=UPI002E148E4A|nr:hypothetical protein OG430_22245 [Streptomyces sp. NBC_01304]